MDELPPYPEFLPQPHGSVGRSEFVEIIPPEPVDMHPQTPAWTVLFVLLGLALCTGLALAVRAYLRNAYRRAALAELDTLRSRLGPNTRTEVLLATAGLLKRCALAVAPREGVAALSGEAWLDFLDSRAPRALSDEARRALSELVIRDPEALPTELDTALLDGVERWVRRHRA